MGRHQRHLAGDLRAADRLGHVLAVDRHPLGPLGAGAELQVQVHQQTCHGAGVGRINAGRGHQPGDGPVHGAGIEIDQAETGGEGLGHGAFAGPGGAIDGNDRRAAHQEHMVDQTGGATEGRRRQEQGVGLQRFSWPQATGLHRLHIVHHQASLEQVAAHRLGEGRHRGPTLEVPGAGQNLLGRRRQAAGQGQGLLLLAWAQIAVAGAQGQAIGLAQGGAAAHLQGQAQVGHQAPQHHQLLPILFPQPKHIGPHQGQQPGHHRGHAGEMARPAAAAEPRRQGVGRLEPGELGRAAGVDLGRAGGEQGIGARCRSQLGIGLQVAGVAIEVLGRAELERIDEDAQQHLTAPRGAGPVRQGNKGLVALVQPTHGWHELERARRALPALAPLAQLGGGVKQTQNNPRNSPIEKPTRQRRMGEGGFIGDQP